MHRTSNYVIVLAQPDEAFQHQAATSQMAVARHQETSNLCVIGGPLARIDGKRDRPALG